MNLTRLHRPIVLVLATLWAGLCLALPAPHDIEQAVADGQLPRAERMLREVIAEKPRSARAQYELAQVLAREGRHEEALQAIRAAREIDPALSFAQSPDKFHAVARAIEAQAASPRSPTAAAAAAPAQTAVVPAAANERPAWLWPVLLSGAFALLVLALWRRLSPGPANPMPPAYAGEAPRGFGAQFDPRGATAYAPPYPAAAPAPAPGSGMAGAVVGGLAGVAAGYALSRALEGPSAGTPHAGSADPRPLDPMEEVGRVRMDSPDSGLGGFDAGSGDSWDTSDSGGSGDSDSW